MAFAIALRDLDWRITYLGRDAPISSVAGAADAVGADAIVFAATMPETLAEMCDALGELAIERPVVVGGPATAEGALPPECAHVLPTDVLTAAHVLTMEMKAPGVVAPAQRTPEAAPAAT